MIGEANAGTIGLQLWDPKSSLRRATSQEAKLSRGFLRCRPERWFPGFGGHWLPLAHSLGLEGRILEVRSTSSVPKNLERGYVGSVDDEPLGIFFDEASAQALVEEVVPGAVKAGSGVVLEYLARRLLSSLALSWSGLESSHVRFERDLTIDKVNVAGGIKTVFGLNANQVTVWIAVGPRLVERLDGLWRRQVQSASRATANGEMVVSLDIVQLGVPPQQLTEYVRTGTVVDVEAAVSDTITLRQQGRPWLSARLVNVDGKFGCEILPGAPPQLTTSEGATRVAIELGRITLEAQKAAEYSQPGAILTTAIPVGNPVTMTVGGDEVARGELNVFEGRFAVVVG